MRLIMLSHKGPLEVIALEFSFDRLVDNVDSVTITINPEHGSDPSASAMLQGGPMIDGPEITQLVRNGIDGVVYKIEAIATSGSQKYELAGLLPVRA